MARDSAGHTVGDYVTLVRGTTYRGDLVGAPGPALLGLVSIEPGGGFRIGKYKTYGGECPAELILFPGDIYASLKGATKDGKMIGSVARVPSPVPSGRLTQDTVKLVFKAPDMAQRSYLYWILRTPQYRAYCEGHAMGSAVVALSRRDFLSFPVPPPTSARLAAARVLDAIEVRLEVNRQMNETLEAMARAIFQDWFVAFGPTRAKMEGRPPYLAPDLWALFPDRLDAEGKPEGWVSSSLKAIADQNAASSIRTGPFGSQLHQSDYTPHGVPVVMPTNLTSGDIVADGIARVSPTTAARLMDHRLEPGDIVYGRRGDIGRKALVADDQYGWLCGTGCLKLRVRSSACPPLFLFHYLNLPATREWIATRAVGATMPNLNTSIIGEVEVLQPGVRMCAAFENVAGHLRARSTANRLESETLAATRDLLLPRLMSGELRVRDAEPLVAEVA